MNEAKQMKGKGTHAFISFASPHQGHKEDSVVCERENEEIQTNEVSA